MDAVLHFLSSFAAIVVINLMLSGDNAIVIALAARNLPQRLQGRAIVFGTVGAVIVRCVMTLAVVWLLEIPGLLFAGGVALAWIGYGLLLPDESDATANMARPKSIWGAIRTIVVADMVMGVDNVLGVAGAAHGSYALVILGLATSVPIVVWGSTWLLKWVERYPAIVYAGAAVLLWTAARMIVSEPLAADVVARNAALVVLLHAVLVVGVLWAGFVRNHRHLESRIHARLAQLATAPSQDLDNAGGSTMKVVLVPVSDLPNSHHAVRRVIEEYLGNPSIDVHLLNVRKPLSSRVSRFVRKTLRDDYHRERAELALAPACKLLDLHKVPYRVHIRVGDAAELIAEQARLLECDRIIMSTARKGSITRILEDSTTERVLKVTPVPVELVVGDAISKLERYGVPAAIGAALLGLVALMAAD